MFTDGTLGKDQNYQGFETVTIREMLQHRSGLIPTGTGSAFRPYYFHATMRSELVNIGAPAELTEYPLPLMGYWALNDTRLPRHGMYQPIRPQKDWQLGNANHPYNTVNQWNPQAVPPLFTDANLQTQTGVLMNGTPTWNDWRDIWDTNVSGRSPSQVPSTVGRASYSGQFAMPGAPLPAGGWEASSVPFATTGSAGTSTTTGSWPRGR